MPCAPKCFHSENYLYLPPLGGRRAGAESPNLRQVSGVESGGPGENHLELSTCYPLSTSHPSSEVVPKPPCEAGTVNSILPCFLNEKLMFGQPKQLPLASELLPGNTRAGPK